MDDWLIAPTVGVVLLCTGIALMRAHVRAWRRQQNDPLLEEADRKHYYARYRRRMQTSGMIALLGVLIPLGDRLMLLKKAPGWVASYWAVVLLMLLWVILCGCGDFASIVTHTRGSLARVRRKQRELERKLSQMKKQGSNGHP